MIELLVGWFFMILIGTTLLLYLVIVAVMIRHLIKDLF